MSKLRKKMTSSKKIKRKRGFFTFPPYIIWQPDGALSHFLPSLEYKPIANR